MSGMANMGAKAREAKASVPKALDAGRGNALYKFSIDLDFVIQDVCKCTP
jgi:hypothetical protein